MIAWDRCRKLKISSHPEYAYGWRMIIGAFVVVRTGNGHARWCGGSYWDMYQDRLHSPTRHADFAWPEQRRAIEVWGGVHTEDHFVRQERVREANTRQIERARAAGWEVMIITDKDLRRDNWEETRERVRGFLE